MVYFQKSEIYEPFVKKHKNPICKEGEKYTVDKAQIVNVLYVFSSKYQGGFLI